MYISSLPKVSARSKFAPVSAFFDPSAPAELEKGFTSLSRGDWGGNMRVTFEELADHRHALLHPAEFNVIPKTTSVAAGPGPSFLTTFAPEIRNAIYELLFERKSPVFLHDSMEYCARVGRLDKASNGSIEWFLCEDNNKGPERNWARNDHIFHHGLGAAMGLLQGCRQIYAEASSVLYSNNTFVFSRVGLWSSSNDYRSEYNQFWYSAQWLASIGSRLPLLKKVDIGIYSMSKAHGICRPGMFDILPMLRLLWQNPNVEFEFGFSFDLSGKQANYINNIFRQFREDKVNVRRFARHRRLLSMIMVQGENYHRYDRVLCFDEKALSHSFYPPFVAKPTAYYQVSATGDALTEIEPSLINGILYLPFAISNKILPVAILNKIIAEVVSPARVITFDVNNRKMHGLDTCISRVSRRCRQTLFSLVVPYNCDIAVSMTTKGPVTSFSDFQDLGKFLAVELFRHIFMSYKWGLNQSSLRLKIQSL
ncbi:hypothetical protein CC80DRAFT_564825 [Byssothecium circinans]|uniref:DUF7730 domain-containing protein n=1 Tax=Byssothecium circinans TaxID=147558 RepID=A0A6A5TX85_9PLEO|nr:hypothetical protein CC80DRAFT_564825 [Byssothecium circinans]